MNLIIAISAGGAVGALGRYFFAQYVNQALVNGYFPVGIIVCNILGAFIMGALTELFVVNGSMSDNMRAFIMVGILGSFTTFSTFALETVLLAQKGQMLFGLLYVVTSVVGAIMALAGAIYLVRYFS